MSNAPKPKVMFLDTNNSARSQMAEAFLRRYAGDRYEVHSAGLDPKGISPLAEQVMAEAGVPMEGQTSKNVKEYLGKVNFGYVITVCAYADATCPRAFLGVSRRLYWELDDPGKFEGDDAARLAMYRKVRDDVDGRVKAWIENPGEGAVYVR